MTGRDPAAVRQAHEDTARAWVDAVLVHGDTDQRSVGRMYGAVGALAAWTDERSEDVRDRLHAEVLGAVFTRDVL